MFLILVKKKDKKKENTFASKLRGPGFEPWPGTVGGLVSIMMWSARPG